MKDLIDAAVRAAGTTGMQAAVVLIGPDKPPLQVPAMEGDAQKALEEAITQRDGYAREVHALQEKLRLAQAQPPAAGMDPSAQVTITQLQDQLSAAQVEIENLKAAAQAAPAAGQPETPDPQRETVDAFDSYGVEHLGLETKEEKAVRKAGFETIGPLRQAYLTDAAALKEKTKLTKDGMISLGVHLLGKAPSASHAPAEPGAAPAAAAPAGGGAPDVPEGHTDRSWMERLNAGRSKEARMKAVEEGLAKLKADAQAKFPQAVENGELKLDKLPPETAEAIRTEENTYNVVRGQMIAMVWSANLPADKGGVDGALEAVQLTQLMEQQPAPAAG